MSILPEKKAQTVDAIYATYTQENPRSHLGASQIGESCERKLWYTFRWCTIPSFEGRILRLFETGKLAEVRLIAELKKAGFEVFDKDETGEQFHFSFGFFGGSLDGVILGIPEAPKTPHVLEIKTSNEQNFKALQKAGVQAYKPLHYAQMQCYMGAFVLTRAFYLVVNKNDDSLYQERIEFDPIFYQSLLNKVERIIASETPLPRISEKPEWYECKLCEHAGVCHHGALPAKNCRTCKHFKTEKNYCFCNLHNCVLGIADQRAGCAQHNFIADLDPIPF